MAMVGTSLEKEKKPVLELWWFQNDWLARKEMSLCRIVWKYNLHRSTQNFCIYLCSSGDGTNKIMNWPSNTLITQESPNQI